MQQCYDIHNISRKLNRYVAEEPTGSNAKWRSEIGNIREDLLKRFCLLRSKGLTATDAAEGLNISRATLYRWRVRSKQGFERLKPQSTRPKQVRKPLWSSELVLMVSRLRKQYPLWGKGKIQVLLAREGTYASVATVGRIISYLIKKGSILSSPILKGHRIPKQRRHFDKHAVRIPKGMKARSVGELVQIDHMTVQMGDKKIKHFNAWDRMSKWNVADVFSQATAYCAAKFLEKVIKEAPFPIRSIQVDGGSEFMAEFEEACKTHGIPLFVLPPRSPEMNGGVERINGTWRDEFYNFYDDVPKNILELSSCVKKYQHIYNTVRPHTSLAFATPLEYINNNVRMKKVSHMS